MEQKNKSLTKEQLDVLREKETEPAFSHPYNKNKDKGEYRCAYCDSLLFKSDAKFDSGTGWPSFDKAIPGAIEIKTDFSLGIPRIEVICTRCKSHLGHVFNDGPKQTTGKRFCINGCALDFKK